MNSRDAGAVTGIEPRRPTPLSSSNSSLPRRGSKLGTSSGSVIMGGLSKVLPPAGGGQTDYSISPPDPTEIENIGAPVLADFKLQLVDLVGEGIVIVDTTGGSMRVAHANRGFEQLTGWKASEVCGSTLQFLQGPGTNEKGVETVLLGLQSGRQVRVLLLNYRRNRTPFWNSIYTLPLPPPQDGSDEQRYVAVVMQDVTEWKEQKDAATGRFAAPRPRPSNPPSASHREPVAKKVEDVSIIVIDFIRIHQYLDSFSDTAVAMRMIKNLMEMIESSLTYFPSLRKVRMSGSSFVAIGGIPVPRTVDPLQEAMKRRLPSRRSTASETDLRQRVERMEREWYELLGYETDEEEEEYSMRRTLSGSEVDHPVFTDSSFVLTSGYSFPTGVLTHHSAPFPAIPSTSTTNWQPDAVPSPQSLPSALSTPKFKAFSSPLPTDMRRRNNSAPPKVRPPTELIVQKQRTPGQSSPSGSSSSLGSASFPPSAYHASIPEVSSSDDEDTTSEANASASLFDSAMQSAMSGIHSDDMLTSGERKLQLMASVKKKLMSVKERRDKGKTQARDREREKEKEREREKEREKETMDKGKDKEREKAAKQLQEKERAYQQQQVWQQAETPQGIEKLKELDKESKRNKKNKALEEMAAFALTVLSKFNALSESALSEARERERRMSSGGGKAMSQSGSHVTTRAASGSGIAGSKGHSSSSTESVPITPSHELSLKVGMHIGRAMVGSIPFALASPSGAVGGGAQQSVPEVWGEALEMAQQLGRSADEGRAQASAAVYERICHKFRFSECPDKSFVLEGYRIK